MRIRVALAGSGQPGDPHRVTLPTYQMILRTPSLGHAIVEIPDDEIAKLIRASSPTVEAIEGVGDVVTGLDAAAARDVLAAIRAKYREHAADYELTVG